MYNYDWNPYAIDPSQYITQAQQPMQGGQPQMAQAQPEQKYFGPSHEALSNYFTQSLGQQVQMPGLLNAMQNDPALAQQVGGLLGGSYTPRAYIPQRVDWRAAQQTADLMPQNFVGDEAKYKILNQPNQAPLPAAPNYIAQMQSYQPTAANNYAPPAGSYAPQAASNQPIAENNYAPPAANNYAAPNVMVFNGAITPDSLLTSNASGFGSQPGLLYSPQKAAEEQAAQDAAPKITWNEENGYTSPSSTGLTWDSDMGIYRGPNGQAVTVAGNTSPE
jgi:hypothetical protein